MSLIVDFQLEKEKRIIAALESHEPVKSIDFAATCACGCTRFYLLHTAKVECVKCQAKQPGMVWSMHDAE